ncbi:hypothetical protein ADUPG1_003570, partial [Aduncisulcus paluster]
TSGGASKRRFSSPTSPTKYGSHKRSSKNLILGEKEVGSDGSYSDSEKASCCVRTRKSVEHQEGDLKDAEKIDDGLQIGFKAFQYSSQMASQGVGDESCYEYVQVPKSCESQEESSESEGEISGSIEE